MKKRTGRVSMSQKPRCKMACVWYRNFIARRTLGTVGSAVISSSSRG
jgi:hypothetical protein